MVRDSLDSFALPSRWVGILGAKMNWAEGRKMSNDKLGQRSQRPQSARQTKHSRKSKTISKCLTAKESRRHFMRTASGLGLSGWRAKQS